MKNRSSFRNFTSFHKTASPAPVQPAPAFCSSPGPGLQETGLSPPTLLLLSCLRDFAIWPAQPVQPDHVQSKELAKGRTDTPTHPQETKHPAYALFRFTKTENVSDRRKEPNANHTELPSPAQGCREVTAGGQGQPGFPGSAQEHPAHGDPDPDAAPENQTDE